ncbi:MAG: phosphate signaling complex protein PhoU [Planctomycetaceae bacterium]|nr:phosphate signaling complex protein PhoU [Planctomycetaceae bacterium]
MTLPFLEHMDQLHSDILTMCGIVEENLSAAVTGLKSRSIELAEQLAARDRNVNELDIQIEDECLKILALYHPVANDLRRVATVLKITGELERVGDLAVNISERSASLCEFPDFPLPEALETMCEASLSMLRRSIAAFIELDLAAANEVCAEDDVVDRMNDSLIADLRALMGSTPEAVEPGLHLFSIVRHLERVADHATNISEDVAYLVSGDIVRHHHGREVQA